MRHALRVAVWSGMLAVAPLCMAQHGGGYGGHAGFSGGHVGGGIGAYHGGFVSGPGRIPTGAPQVMGSAPRVNGGAPRFVAPYNAPLYGGARAESRPGYGGHGGYGSQGNGNHGRDGDHARGRRGYGGYGGYGYGIPYVNSWEVLPWDLGYSDFGDQSAVDQSGDNGSGEAYAGEAQQQDQAQEGQAEQDRGQQYQGPPPPPPDYGNFGYRQEYQGGQAPADETTLANEPKLTLVFKDGHTESIRNFVLTPSAVIVMDEAKSGRQMRIPLAEVNVAATEKAAQEQGLDFSPPA